MEPNNDLNNNPNPMPSPMPNPASPAGEPMNPAAGAASEAQMSGAAPEGQMSGAAPEVQANPAGDVTGTPAMAAGGMTTPAVNPIINPTEKSYAQAADKMALTDPIMQPEPAPEPDPVEEELKAPMVAAAPAPGSIGSAVSGAPAAQNTEMPAEQNMMTTPAGNPFENDKQTPSVAFNDPAMQPDPATMAGNPAADAANQMANPAAAKPKPKTNKATLIALIVVAAIIVVVLVAVLVMQLNSGKSSNNNGSSAVNTPVVIDEEVDEEVIDDEEAAEDDDDTVIAAGAVTCTRAMTAEELSAYTGATSGAIAVSANFDADDELTDVSLTESVVYDADPVEEKVVQTTVDLIDSTEAATYYLPVDKEGGIDFTKGGVQMNWVSLEFDCE